MAEKKTLAGRVDPEMEKRFEEYRETYNLNKSEALRRLVESGLEAEQSEESEDVEEDVEIGPLTQSEKWFRQKFESSIAGMFLSAAVTLALFLALVGTQYFLSVNAGKWLPTMILALVIFIGMAAFLVSIIASVVTGLFWKMGWARKLDQWGEEASEQEAAT